MKLNKWYKLNPALKEHFFAASGSNKDMADLIDTHGGSFMPKDFTTMGGDMFLTMSLAADGTELSSSSMNSYFELVETEFPYFMECSAPMVEDSKTNGVNSAEITVTRENATEMIEFIQKTFL